MLPDITSCFHRIIRHFAIALLLIGGIQSATAEQSKRWYDVEVIIFNQKSQQYRDSETWPVDIPHPDMANTRSLTSGRGAFSRLKNASLRLNAEAKRIREAPELELLLHTGWRQPGLSKNQAVSIPIYAGTLEGVGSASRTHRLEGTLKLVLSRYLHIYTDLLYREPLAGGEMQAISQTMAIGDQAAGNSPAPQHKVYRMQQSRRMRSRELHYLDHPVLGMIIRVTPVSTGG